MSEDSEKKPGPKPDHLKLDGPWEERLEEVLEKERPEEGWPKPEDDDHEKENGDPNED